jgi:hypothetical protein
MSVWLHEGVIWQNLVMLKKPLHCDQRISLLGESRATLTQMRKKIGTKMFIGEMLELRKIRNDLIFFKKKKDK